MLGLCFQTGPLPTFADRSTVWGAAGDGSLTGLSHSGILKSVEKSGGVVDVAGAGSAAPAPAGSRSLLKRSLVDKVDKDAEASQDGSSGRRQRLRTGELPLGSPDE